MYTALKKYSGMRIEREINSPVAVYRTGTLTIEHLFFTTYHIPQRLTGDARKIFVSKTVDESHSARVLIGCKPITQRTSIILSRSLRFVYIHLKDVK